MRGFTLVELLIVIIILAVLAAVVIPAFSQNKREADVAAVTASMTVIRSATERYALQHDEVYPGKQASKGAIDCASTAGAGNDKTALAFTEQLTFYSDKSGKTCSIASAKFRYGPYLRSVSLPINPATGGRTLGIINNTLLRLNGRQGDVHGDSDWLFNVNTGLFEANYGAFFND